MTSPTGGIQAATLLTTGADGSLRVPEDILFNPLSSNPQAQTSPLVKRGQPWYIGNPQNGFPGDWQHFTGSGQARSPVYISGKDGGLLYSGVGAENDGYGEIDSGVGGYLRLGRDIEDCWITFSCRFALFGEVQGAITNPVFYIDTQSWDGTQRCYPRVAYNQDTPTWRISKDSTAIPPDENHPYAAIPGQPYLLGDNEAKGGTAYIAFSFYLGKSTPIPGGGVLGKYGHFQHAGMINNLSGLGAGGSINQTQGSPVPFDGGCNVGYSASTPLPGKSGSLLITRMEVTIGDALVNV